MKKYFRFLILSPCLMAVLCEEDTVVCGFSDPEPYTLNVENTSEIYAENEIIWLNAEVTSMLFDECDETEELVLITDATEFRGGFFLLKLNDGLTGLNAEFIEDFTVDYSLGEPLLIGNCLESVSSLPVLSDDNLTYNYRLGITINSPGDYCIVNTFNNNFNAVEGNNAAIFDAYDTLDNKIKFNVCGDIYTRTGTEGHYFFRVQ
ncbi:hypothetical protein [Winogradskyella sp. PE311]|uniref:hypothetical protein n=1 Tax=Winogradskyella sp. PE311 TaxID=3366943 RepID=UPI00397EDC21